jgi:putative DNA primase/helicase
VSYPQPSIPHEQGERKSEILKTSENVGVSTPGGPDTDLSEFMCLADVKPTAIEYVIPNLVATNWSLLEGPPGGGKSILVAMLAAHITTGQPFPWEPSGTPWRAPAGVLILKAEDGVSDILVPRMQVAGVDMTQVRIWKAKRAINLVSDLDKIRAAVKKHGVKLIVIDGLFSTVGNIDLNKDNQIRQVIDPIAAMAQEDKVAVLAVRHTVKTVKDLSADSLGIGGRAWSGVGRSTMYFGESHIDKTLHGLTVSKTNIKTFAVLKDFLLFRRKSVDHPTPEIGDQPVFEFEGVHDDRTIEEFVAPTLGQRPAPGRPPKTRDKAVAFLKEVLKDGGRWKGDVYKEGKARGFSSSTLDRACDELDVVKEEQKNVRYGPVKMRLADQPDLGTE